MKKMACEYLKLDIQYSLHTVANGRVFDSLKNSDKNSWNSTN